MRKQPTLTRKRDIFTRRYIITMPPWAPWLVAIAIFAAIALKAEIIATAFCMVMALLSATFCRIAWYHMREVRIALHDALNDIDNDDLDPLALEEPVAEPVEDQVYRVPM
jgi:hypothetical protein